MNEACLRWVVLAASVAAGLGPQIAGAQPRQDVPAPALWELRAANECLQKQDCACAIPSLERAIQLYSSYGEALATLGYCYFQQGRAEDAIQKANAALAISKREPMAYLTLGMAFEQQGKLEQAATNYEAALKLRKNQNAAHLGLARVYERLNQKERAIAEYKEVIEENPQNVAALTSLSQLHLQMGQPKEAEAALREILKLDPESPAALMRLGSLYIETKQYDRAVESLQSVLRIDYNQPIIHFRLGEVYTAAGKSDQASTHYSIAIELDPNFLQAKLALADLQVSLKQIQPALDLYEQVIAGGRSDFLEPATQKKIQLLLATGKVDKAAEAADIALGLFPENPTFIRLAAQRRAQAGNGAQALDLVSKLAKANPEDADSWALKGSLELGLAKLADAEASFQKALTLAPESVPALSGLGYIAASAGDAAKATEYLNKALALKPEDISALNNLAMLKRATAPAESLELLNRAAKINAQSPVLKNNIAVLLAQSGKIGEARPVLEGLVKSQPDEPDWRWNLAILLAGAGAAQDALNLLQPLAGEGSTSATVLKLLGDLNHKLGLLEQSEVAYRKALDTGIKDPKVRAIVLYNLGTTFLLRERRRPRAQASLAEAIQLDPQLAEAQNNLGCVSFFNGRLDEAKSFFRAAMRLRPDERLFLMNLVGTGEAVSQAEMARVQQLSAADRSMAETQVAESLLAQGFTALTAKRWNEAVTLLSKAKESGAGSPELENALAVALIRLQRFDDARSRLEAALTLQPSSAEALLNMALLQELHSKDLPGALGYYERYLKVAQDPKISRYVERKKRFLPASQSP